jgi:hypothetical protein
MTSVIPATLGAAAFTLLTNNEVSDWIAEVSEAVSGVSWRPLGGIDNNVHTVEVASDPASALVEIPVNGIDALLELAAIERAETAPSPQAAAHQWYGIPAGGLAEMTEKDERGARAGLAQLLRVTMSESGDPHRPTIVVQDQGTGHHPNDWPQTLLSLLASNNCLS